MSLTLLILDVLRNVPENIPPPTDAFHYNGIEGLRMSQDGDRYWNKSSQDGNQQDPVATENSSWLFPLMFPGTIPIDSAFIANHHYRKIQRVLECLQNPDGSVRSYTDEEAKLVCINASPN